MNILIDGQTFETPEINRGIGIYLKNTLNNMVKQSFIHNWYVTVSNKECLKSLDPWVRKRLIPIEDEIFKPSSDYRRTEKFTEKIESVVDRFNIDVYWNPNPLMINVLFINRSLKCKMYSMLHDIIPFIMPVKEWSKEVKNEYNRRIEYLKSEDMNLLCNSQATRDDFFKYICERPGLYVTELAADSKKYYKKRLKSGINSEPCIVFTGGFDYRKNMDGAVKAFAKAKEIYKNDEIIQKANMYIVCSASDEIKTEFYNMVKKLGIDGKVKLTGYISDEELQQLYFKCDVFFFPSLYEGFGLPIVEAMLSGAYILSADNSSLPEVCGGNALLCDAHNIKDMAEKIKTALYNAKNETLDEKNNRQEYALNFSWEKTADKTLTLFEKKTEETIIKRKIAIVTPWPKQKTGIANFIFKLIPYLVKYFDIDIFVDNTVDSQCELLEYKYGNLYLINQLEKYHSQYDEIIYQMGNSSEFHTGIYNSLIKYKGIVEVHDYIIHPFFYHSYFLKKKYSVYKQALIDGYGKEGEIHYKSVREKLISPDNEKFPMIESVSNISKATIVHNHWSKEQLNKNNVFVIPHSCFDKEEIDDNLKRDLLEKLKNFISYKNEIVIGCFGFVNENKRPIKLISAVERLLKDNIKVKLVFFGELNYKEIENYIIKNKLNDKIFITGYLNEKEYETALEFVDIVVNLRFPSMGEASGTLCESFKYGKSVLVSDLNQYTEYPDEICWKVPIENLEVETLAEMIKYLAKNPDVKQALEKNAKEYADKVLNPKKIAKMYYDVINNLIESGDNR